MELCQSHPCIRNAFSETAECHVSRPGSQVYDGTSVHVVRQFEGQLAAALRGKRRSFSPSEPLPSWLSGQNPPANRCRTNEYGPQAEVSRSAKGCGATGHTYIIHTCIHACMHACMHTDMCIGIYTWFLQRCNNDNTASVQYHMKPNTEA